METDNPSVGGGSPERFGFEWATYDKIDPNYEKHFRRWLPFYDKSDWVGKNFLDVGCGMGRNSYWPMSYGAATGLAIDGDQLAKLAVPLKNSGYGDYLLQILKDG